MNKDRREKTKGLSPSQINDESGISALSREGVMGRTLSGKSLKLHHVDDFGKGHGILQQAECTHGSLQAPQCSKNTYLHSLCGSY